MRYKSVILFGAPGSGKGTQGHILGQIPGFFHTSSGDIFRSIDLHSPNGRTVWEHSSRGELVPDELTVEIWKKFIYGTELTNRFHPETECLVLDGIPRSVEQAKLLEGTLDVARIIHLVADLDKMVERLRRRALKENRFDDASDGVIRERLKVYENVTKPLLDYYGDKPVVEIDASMSQIRVLSRIVDVLVPVKEEMERDADPIETRGSGDGIRMRAEG